ncbi:MAG: hypothetical protein QNJ72_19090 [Pleurocapsa sp. MO_226.B13]|nr:hypothetical protein [Pleurocapsa sp. MO_226.B13]
MQNNTSKNQQLLKDRLFLEKVFLLDIESDRKTNTTDLIPILEPQSKQSDRSNDVRLSDVDIVSTPVPQRTIAPISLVSIYAVVVTLLLLLPSNREGANGKTVIEDAERENERISLLETKIQQLEAKTQILASEVNVDSQHGSSPLIETAEPVSLPVHLTATKLEAIDLESGRGVDNSTQRTTDSDRLPPLSETASSPVVIQTPIQSSIADTVDTAIISTDRLPPLPVPTPPSFATQISSPLPLPPTFAPTATAVDTVNLNSSNEFEIEPTLEIKSEKSEIIVPEITVEEKIDKPAEQWLGQTDVVYYSFSFQENSTPENLAEAEASLPDDEDLKQYLTAVKSRSHRLLRRKTTEPAVTVGKVQAGEQPTSSLLSTEQPLTSDRILDSDSQPIAEPTQLLPDVKNNESLAEPKLIGFSFEEDLEQYLDSDPLFDNESELPSTAFNSKKSSLPTLFEDEDLARYLDAPLLDDELVRQILGTSTSTDRNEVAISEEADENPKSTEQPSEEKKIRRSLAIEVERESQARQPLFADEDLRQFLTHTPLFSDSVLKEKLKSKQ